MAFPETRQTMIRRLVAEGQERDWHQFMSDYWMPVCGFARRWGRLGAEDAEDVASATFMAIVQNRLIERWAANRSSKLRTLLCTVVRQVIANLARVRSGRERLMREHFQDLVAGVGGSTVSLEDAVVEDEHVFDGLWAQSMLQQAVEALMAEYHEAGKGDYFRVLYGRICEDMTMPQIGEALGITTTTAENYYKSARRRMESKLRELVKERVQRYCDPEMLSDEFEATWEEIGAHLLSLGGLEEAILKACDDHEPAAASRSHAEAITRTLRRLAEPPEGH
ncbi:MAG: hypothetical protein CMJ18_19075 [Phycisphaeraceae bacterium]|nr:hypothetical protein [Phycisphaeraceae bacterium]